MDFRRVLPVFVLVFVDVLGLSILLPLLHLYGAAYGATPLQIGLIAAAFPIAQLIGVPVMGALSDRYGRKPLLLISQVTTFLSFILLGVANSLFLIILSRVVDGLFGANIATAQAALTDLTDEENRTQALGLTGAAFGLGFILGPVFSIVALEISGSLSAPAFTAAVYSLLSILLTLFIFKETLPKEKRSASVGVAASSIFTIFRMLRVPKVNGLLLLIFAQQFVFFGFETLFGLFLLSRLGLLGQGTALIFILVGVVLVLVQGYFIGRWSRRFGDRRLIIAALGLLGIGLVLMAFTPAVPQPFYVRDKVAYELQEQANEGPDDTAQAIIGDISVELPPDGNNGVLGILWVAIVIVPIAIGAGLIRPSINSLLTKSVSDDDYGSALGTSSAFVSIGNASAPLFFGLMFQQYGATIAFSVGGVLLLGLMIVSAGRLRT